MIENISLEETLKKTGIPVLSQFAVCPLCLKERAERDWIELFGMCLSCDHTLISSSEERENND